MHIANNTKTFAVLSTVALSLCYANQSTAMQKFVHQMMLKKHGLNQQACLDRLLWQALTTNTLSMAQAALALGAQIDTRDDQECTPLHRAVMNNNPVFVQFLIQHKANLEAKNNQGRTPLHIAAHNNNSNIVSLLIESKADVESKSDAGYTPLHYATNTKVIKKLLRNHANVNVQGALEITPLHMAAATNNMPKTILLIIAGADINIPNRGGQTAAIIARERGHTSLADFLDNLFRQEN